MQISKTCCVIVFCSIPCWSFCLFLLFFTKDPRGDCSVVIVETQYLCMFCMCTTTWACLHPIKGDEPKMGSFVCQRVFDSSSYFHKLDICCTVTGNSLAGSWILVGMTWECEDLVLIISLDRITSMLLWRPWKARISQHCYARCSFKWVDPQVV